MLLEGAEDGEPLVQYAAEDAARANGGECVDHRLVGRVVGGDGDSEGSEEGEHQHWVVGKMRRVGELVGVGPHREHRRLELARHAKHGDSPIEQVVEDERQHKADPQAQRARHLEPQREKERVRPLERCAAMSHAHAMRVATLVLRRCFRPNGRRQRRWRRRRQRRRRQRRRWGRRRRGGRHSLHGSLRRHRRLHSLGRFGRLVWPPQPLTHAAQRALECPQQSLGQRQLDLGYLKDLCFVPNLTAKQDAHMVASATLALVVIALKPVAGFGRPQRDQGARPR